MKKRAFILILLMCSVVLVSLATFAEVVDIRNKNTALLSGEDEKPVISDDIQSRVAETLNGFTGGFLENTGQKNGAIYFYTESTQMAVGFGTSELRFNIFHPSSSRLKSVKPLEEPSNGPSVRYTPITLTFLGSNLVIPVAYEPTGVYCHYFKGSDPSKWQVNNQYYTKLIYHDLYEQIDLVYELKQGQLKYEFFVHPGGQLEDIQLHWTGPVSLQLLEQGMQVQVHQVSRVEGDCTPDFSFFDTSPIIYQSLTREDALPGSFELLQGTTYGFSVPSYDPTKLLIIDPLILSYSTYVSGTNEDRGYGIAVDGAGNAYVTGYTASTDFPTVNAYMGDGGSLDVFVCKLSSAGSSLLYSTYVGGSDIDDGYGIAVDGAGNAYVTGHTLSTDFPTVNPYNATNSGTWDVFVCKLSSAGSTLLYSTYVGGSDIDDGFGIAVDSMGNAYITGQTRSTDFPTVNPYNATGDGSSSYYDAFVFKLSPGGNSLLYSTYVSGSHNDVGRGIAVDATGNAYVTGCTWSIDFPTTVNAYNATGDGNPSYQDVFVFKLSSDGSTLLYSTYVSGSHHDYGYAIAIDGAGNAYVTGTTTSTDFPTVNAYDATGDGSTSHYDAFVFKLAANGSTLLYSTYVSGSHSDEGQDIAVDSMGNAYVIGHTASSDFPTVNAYMGDGGGTDVFVFKLAANGNSLLYSTYVSGSDLDYARGIAVDSTGNAYVTGHTLSTDFPTVNPYNATGGGISWDVFVCKLFLYSQPTPPQGLAVAISADSKVILIWGEPMDDGNAPITAYRVYRSTTSGVYGSFLAEATSEAFIDSTAVSGVDYFYVVTAVNSVGESALSNEVTIIIPTPITVPSAPQSLSATPGNNFVYLSWSAPSSDGGSVITRYRVYRGTSSGDYFFLGVATSTSFNDTTALGGTTYYYMVTAVNAVGESGFSNEVSTTAAGSPPGPVTTTVTTTMTTTVTSFTSSSETTPITSPGFEVIGLVIALTSLVITAVIYRRRKNA